MPNSLRRSVPFYRAAPLCNQFQADMGGRFTYIEGEAVPLTGISQEQWPKTTVAEITAQSPELTYFYARLYAGHPAESVCQFAGQMWQIRGAPIVLAGVQTGIAGVAWLLTPEPEPEAPAPGPDYTLWEAAGDNARFQVWSGDRFHVSADGVVQYRRIPLADFETYRSAYPNWLHRIADVPIVRRALRLLPPG